MIDFKRLIDLMQAPSSDPLDMRLWDALRAQLTDGTFRAGDPFPSEAILRDKLKIEPDVIHEVIQRFIQTGLIEASPEGGLFALGKLHLPAQVNPVQSGQVVGLIAGQSTFHIYYAQLVPTFNQILQAAGWVSELAVHEERPGAINEIVNDMLQRGVRAFLINPPTNESIQPLLDDLRKRGILFQLVGRWLDYPECDFVGVDNVAIGYQATRHLLDLGHTQVVYTGGAHYSTNCDRVRGYLRAMSEAGLRGRLFNVHTHRIFPVVAEFQLYLDSENTPTALWREMVRHRITATFCFNCEEATWVYNEIRKFNLTVPRDISLITVDNPPIGSPLSATLTTYALPGEEMGCEAANLLLRRLKGEDFPPQKVFLPGKLVLRTSTGIPRDWRAARG